MARDRQHRDGREATPLVPILPSQIIVHDHLADSFPLMQGESQWLLTLLADEIARILADD